MSQEPLKISVVICTRDRPDTVGQALESVAECDFPSFDVHVMDQSTTNATREIVESLAQRFQAKVRLNYHHLEKAGLSRAYNAGARASGGALIAYTDDDVVVPRDWLSRIERAFDADANLGLLFGQVLVPDSLKDVARDGVVVPTFIIEKRERFAKGEGFRVCAMGANMAIRRSLLDRVVGFDEALGGGGPLRSSQDFDFAYRTYVSGMAVLLEPDVKVDHYGTRTEAQWPATLKAYGIGDGAFYSKHIRCGDVHALWLFTRRLLHMGAREAKHLLTKGELKRDQYTLNLIEGVREGSKFAVDRRTRLYRETERGKMTVTDANAVTATQKSDRRV
ncbi:MAG TPA: glycosyltransferase family A protein [Polyangiaceae bacterium]